MFKQLVKASLLSFALLIGFNSVKANEERDIIKQCIDQVIANIPRLLEEFRQLTPADQNLVLDLFSKILQPNNLTEEQAQLFQKNILGHLDNNVNAKEFFQKKMQEIATLCQPYLQYLETLFEAENKNAKNDQEKFNLFMSLNQRAAELYQMGISFYYDALYTFVKEMSPNNLTALLADEGDIIPANKRSKKIPSIEEIQDLIKEAQTTAQATQAAAQA